MNKYRIENPNNKNVSNCKSRSTEDMIRQQKRLNHLFRNKLIIILIGVIIVIGLLISVIVKTYQSPIERKLIGSCNVEIENSYWERDSIYNWCLTIMKIEDKNQCILPRLCDTNLTVYEMKAKASGTWEIISTNPDYVFFNVPDNPLHGKYAIRFFIDEKGYGEAKNNIYKIELKNDSTYLICNKGGFILNNTVKDWDK